MRVTIIVEDNTAIVEGVPERVDCSLLFDTGIHAIQWYGDRGEIEFITSPRTGKRHPNLAITEFNAFQYLVDAWEIEARKETP